MQPQPDLHGHALSPHLLQFGVTHASTKVTIYREHEGRNTAPFLDKRKIGMMPIRLFFYFFACSIASSPDMKARLAAALMRRSAALRVLTAEPSLGSAPGGSGSEFLSRVITRGTAWRQPRSSPRGAGRGAANSARVTLSRPLTDTAAFVTGATAARRPAQLRRARGGVARLWSAAAAPLGTAAA